MKHAQHPHRRRDHRNMKPLLGITVAMILGACVSGESVQPLQPSDAPAQEVGTPSTSTHTPSTPPTC